MLEIKQTPEQNHAAALADFRDFLEEIKDECLKVIRAASNAEACVGPMLVATPDRAGMSEAALIDAAKSLDAFDWRKVSDDLRTEAHRIEAARRELCGALQQAQQLRRYLEAGDFSD
jgi:hypothetical protein